MIFYRYINICHHKLFIKVFSKRWTFVYCILTWCVGFLVDLPNILGWGRHSFDVATLSCLWDRRANHGYTLFFPLTTIVFPCCGILFCYYKIFMFVKESKKRVAQSNGSTDGSANKNNLKNKNSQIEIAKGLFSAYALFTLCW